MIKILKLSDVCTDIIDCPHESPVWLTEGYARVIRNFNLIDGQISDAEPYYVDENTYNKRTRRAIPEPGDIIFSREAPIGNCAIVPKGFKCCLGQRLVLLKVDHSKVSSNYLLTVLMSNYVKYQIEQVSKRGSIVSNFNIGDLSNLKIPVQTNQSDIAQFANDISSKITNNRCINNKLESLAKTIYDYWFLQFEFPNEEGKPYKSSGGKMVWCEELKREIPEGWEVSTLKNMYEIKRGISYSSKDIESGEGIPMINLACIDINRNYRDGELKYYNRKNAPILDEGDMLIATTDLTRNADIVGCPIITPYDGNKYTYSMDLARIDINCPTLSKWYVYSTLRTESYHNYIKKWASGTNVLHLNLDGMNWYTTLIPDIAVQKTYAGIIEPIVKKQSLLMKENRELSSLRDFLLPMLMNGQVTFKDN